MQLAKNKTKIVATIGPACRSLEMIKALLAAGMNVARLNFSHEDFGVHGEMIKVLRRASCETGRRLSIMVDLPGPKMRIGKLGVEPLTLKVGDLFTLTTDEIVGDQGGVSVSFKKLPEVVRSGDALYLNDGFIQLEVVAVQGPEARCRVVVGGELRSKKGLNIPGINLGISAFTERDQECLAFALANGVDAISQSFVESADDIRAVRAAAQALGANPMVIAKIERTRALAQLDSILEVSDGIMIARGDLGVEIPIEQIAVVQKDIMRRANLAGKPVITATQMLESMTENLRPTRAEATDVANAILDGTDCVMLSAESALGKYPVESVGMLAKIAAAIEKHRPERGAREALEQKGELQDVNLGDLLALSVERALEQITPAAVVIPTRSGGTVRRLARFRLPVWITAVSRDPAMCQNLQFCYGVCPEYVESDPEDWRAYARQWLDERKLTGNVVILTQGPSAKHPEAPFSMEIMRVK